MESILKTNSLASDYCMYANEVYETMTRLQIGEFTVRLWVNKKGLTFGPEKIPQNAVGFLTGLSYEEIVKYFKQLFGTNLAAIEILNYHGNGLVYYPDWK